MTKFQVLIIGRDKHLASMLIDFFEEEKLVEILVHGVDKPMPVSPHMVFEPNILNIDDVKMQIAEKFLEWSEEYGA